MTKKLKKHRLTVSPHTEGSGWVAGIYTHSGELVQVGFEPTKEAAMEWGVATINLMEVDGSLSAPDLYGRKIMQLHDEQ